MIIKALNLLRLSRVSFDGSIKLRSKDAIALFRGISYRTSKDPLTVDLKDADIMGFEPLDFWRMQNLARTAGVIIQA